MLQCTFDSPLGLLRAQANSEGIYALDFTCKDEKHSQENEHITQLRRELDAYFEGKLKHFLVPLVLIGTPFQKRVWEVLRTIPYGETISYSQEACVLHHPKAVRAVANANGKNPIAILIPCHRVIAKDGSLGGYSSGVWRKEYLLNLEQQYR